MSIFNKKSLFAAASLAAIFVACTKDVTVPALAYVPKWSIQCLLEPGREPRVFVYQTVPFFDAHVLPVDLFARGAKVEISSPDGSETLKADSVWNEVRCHFDYFFVGKKAVENQKTYQLKVVTGGETFAAIAATDRRKATLDSVGYTKKFKDLYGEHEGIVLHFTDAAGAGDFYRFEMSRVFGPTDSILGVGKVFSACAFGRTTRIEEIGRSIYPDQNADGQTFELTIEPTYKHKKGQVGWVRLQTMDAAAHAFFDQFDRQKLAQFNPFVEPVFINPGQFGERAFGFFGAVAVSDSVRFEYPE